MNKSILRNIAVCGGGTVLIETKDYSLLSRALLNSVTDILD